MKSSPAESPFLHGLLLGTLLPLAALLAATPFTDLRAWFTNGASYGLMPLFLLAAIPGLFATRALRGRYASRGLRPFQLTHGMLLGGWLLGTILLLVATQGADPTRRLLSAVSGGLMLVGFWMWIGSLIGQIGGPADSAATAQTQPLTPPPK